MRRCCTALRTMRRTSRSSVCHAAQSRMLRGSRVRRGVRNGWTSSSARKRDQWTSALIPSGRRRPQGIVTWMLWSAPRTPSKAAAVGPDTALVAGHWCRAAQNCCWYVSSALCTTTTPRPGRDHRRASIAARTSPRVRYPLSWLVARTPRCALASGPRTGCVRRSIAT